MGLVGLEPTVDWLKARCISHYATNPLDKSEVFVPFSVAVSLVKGLVVIGQGVAVWAQHP